MALGSTVPDTQAYISLRAYANPTGSTQSNVINWMSADSLVAKASAVHTYTVAAATSNSSIALASLFAAYSAPIFVVVSEQTNPGLGFLITTVSGSGKVGVATGGWWGYVANGSTALPTIYIDNTDASETLVLSIGILAI